VSLKIAKEARIVLLSSVLGLCIYRAAQVHATAWVPKKQAYLFVPSNVGVLLFLIGIGIMTMKLWPGKALWGVLCGIVVALMLMPNY